MDTSATAVTKPKVKVNRKYEKFQNKNVTMAAPFARTSLKLQHGVMVNIFLKFNSNEASGLMSGACIGFQIL